MEELIKRFKELSEENDKLSKQRAALWGIIYSIIHSDEDTPLRKIKIAVAGSVSMMIDMDLMLCDEIEVEAATIIRDMLLSEKAVKDVEDLLKP